MPLYFAEAAISDGIRDPDDPRLVQVGRLAVDDRGDGSGLLTVPEVPNGRYVVMTYCKPCAPNSAGRVILPLGPFPSFTVVGNLADRSALVWPWIVGGLLGGVLAAAAFRVVVPKAPCPVGGWSLRRKGGGGDERHLITGLDAPPRDEAVLSYTTCEDAATR